MVVLDKQTVIDVYNKIDINHGYGHIWDQNKRDILRMFDLSASPEEFIETIVNETGYYGLNRNFHTSAADTHRNYLYEKWMKENSCYFDSIEHQEQQSYLSKHKMSFLRCCSMATSISKHIPKANLIVEIGAGYGELARIVQSKYKCKYIICDIPITLLSSFTFLTLNNKKVTVVTSDSSFHTAMLDDTEFILIPNHDIDKYPISPTLVINTASFCEMADSYTQQYLNLIQKKWKAEYFYSVNNFLNSKQNSPSKFHFSIDENWDVITWEVSPVWARNPYFDTWHTRFLELFLKRNTNIDPIARERDLYTRIVETDYFKYIYKGKGFTDGNMLDNHNSHYQKGCLYYMCWDYLRYNNTNIVILELMLFILSHSNSNCEEIPILQELLKNIP